MIPVLSWLLIQVGVSCPIEPQWAEMRNIRRNRPRTLAEKISFAIDKYPCDLLFVHRDAEGANRKKRVCEIFNAVNKLNSEIASQPRVCVIPVRMQEAWLLFDERSIRRAAGNPNGRDALDLPQINRLESLPDPKALLYDQLTIASGLTGRRRKSFRPNTKVHLVSEYTDDFSPLFDLPAFASLRDDLCLIVALEKWNNS